MRDKKSILYGIAIIFIATLITISSMHLWGKDINIPLTGYRSDSVGVLLEAANYARGGNVHRNVITAMPGVDNWQESLGDSSVPIPLIKILWDVIGSLEAAVNVYAILNSVMLALSMYLVCCKLNRSNITSAVVAIAYSNLTYFVLHCNTFFLIYGACFYIPVFFYLMIDIMDFEDDSNILKKALFAIVSMIYMGLNSLYYSFFGICILAFVFVCVLLFQKNVGKVVLTAISAISLFMGIVTNIFPDVMYKMGTTAWWDSGYYYLIWMLIWAIWIGIVVFFFKKIYQHITIRIIYGIVLGLVILTLIGLLVLRKYSSFIGEYDGRSLYMVELGGFRIVNILLPAINTIWNGINEELPVLVPIKDGDMTVLGIMGGMGFSYSFFNIFPTNKECRTKRLLQILGVLNIFMVLLAIKGGISSIIAMFLTTGIRCYNRMCVFIGCTSLIAFAVMMDSLIEYINNKLNYLTRKMGYVIVTLIIVALFTLSVPTDFIYEHSFGLVDYEQRKAEYEVWYDLINRIETSVPEHSSIMEIQFQPDYERFVWLLEEGMEYDLTIPAIISKTSVWVTIKNDNIVDMDTFIKQARENGYRGIYIDTIFCSDGSDRIMIKQLEDKLGVPIICDYDRRYFFGLS